MHATNDILNFTFKPKFKIVNEDFVSDKNLATGLEIGFYKSMNVIKENHNVHFSDYSDVNFPFNIALTNYELINSKPFINTSSFYNSFLIKNIESDFIVEHTKELRLPTVIYYIPLSPLYHFKRSNKQVYELILCIYTYLHNVVGVTIYDDDFSYISHIYDMIKESFDYDYEDEKDKVEFKNQINFAETMARTMGSKIASSENIDFWELRLSKFKPNNDIELKYFKIAKEFYDLYSKYPNSSIYRNMNYDSFEDADDVIYAEQYIHFIHDMNDELHKQVHYYINSYFENSTEIQVPAIKSKFDDSFKLDKKNELEFEKTFFSLLTNFLLLLNSN